MIDLLPSANLRDFIIGWEARKLKRYKDSAGLDTIGVGHLCKAGEDWQSITPEFCDSLLQADLERTARGLAMSLSVEPTQQQWDACVSIAFNEGVSAIGRSTLLSHLNRGELAEASYQFTKWIYDTENGKKVASEGLEKRRDAERAIFDSGDYSGRP